LGDYPALDFSSSAAKVARSSHPIRASICAMEIVRFYCKCARYAWAGSWSRANSTAAVGGGIILAIASHYWGLKMDAPTSIQGVIAFGVGVTVASIAVMWVLIYFGRFVAAPARLYRQLEATIPPPQISDIELILHDNMWLEGGLKDAEGHDLPDAMLFRVRLTNVGNKFLQQCQVTFGLKDRYSYPVSGYFDLRRGEYKDIPVLRINHLSDDPHAFVYFLNSDWQIDSGAPKWLVPPSIYEIRVLSADTHPTSLNVELSANPLPPHRPEWKLVAC
jgi:hypothetical protein